MLDQANEVIGFGMCDAYEDADALAKARAWLSKYSAVEVWVERRMVATVTVSDTVLATRQWMQHDAENPSETP